MREKERPLSDFELSMLEIIAIVKEEYPNFNKEPRRAAVLWGEMFNGEDPRLVAAAVKGHIATNKFAPQIAEIKAMIRKLREPQVMTELQAWMLVKKAISDSTWHAMDEHKKLPPQLQELVSPNMLRDWAMSENFNEGVESSNFMRSYRAAAARKIEMDVLPEDIKKLITEYAGKALPEGAGGTNEITGN